MRKDLSQFKECLNSELGKKMNDQKNLLYKKFNIKSKKDHTKVTEMMKQKNSASACRIKRYTERSTQYKQNKLFAENTRKFYNSILLKKKEIKQTPVIHKIENY